MDEILIVRHAEPALRHVFLGSLDPGLSPAGLIEAGKLVLPKNLPVYSSPLRRARETADAAGLEYQVIEEFREIHYGPWEGLSWQEIETRFPTEASQKLEDWLHRTVPGAEPWADFEQRVAAGWARCARPCVIIAHQAVNSVLRQCTTGEPPVAFQQAYCEIVRLKL